MTKLYKFIDIFAGCGGFSLGLTQAGLQGQFAIERDSMAFETFSDNFLGNRMVPIPKFKWPSWLEQRAWSVEDLLEQHSVQLSSLRGKIDVLAGGPPCQGFSFAGKRQEFDPRNMMFEKYVHVVDVIQPSVLVLENVPGMRIAHSRNRDKESGSILVQESFCDKLLRSLESLEYSVQCKVVDASQFGVPQKRLRLIVVGVKRQLTAKLQGGISCFYEILEAQRQSQLHELGLKAPVSVEDALSDLRVDFADCKPCVDPYSPSGFQEIFYQGPDTVYQNLMHRNCQANNMDSMRLVKHREKVRERFEFILNDCAKGVAMNPINRKKYGIKKHRIHPMLATEPGPTVTTLPDDLLHYAEPRILTVRETARLQSFPDWFRFRGKFTTGGKLRTKECPRYTQVGNAVPPLLSRAIGSAVIEVLKLASQVVDDSGFESSMNVSCEVIATA